jgi:hypothetical protein
MRFVPAVDVAEWRSRVVPVWSATSLCLEQVCVWADIVGSRANLTTMTDEPQEAESREDRDRERSDEAHWRVAEEGAEGEPKQTTEKGLEIPVPKRDESPENLRKLSEPDR